MACGSWAKALRYKENEFKSDPSTASESLITINQQLDLPEAATGIILVAPATAFLVSI